MHPLCHLAQLVVMSPLVLADLFSAHGLEVKSEGIDSRGVLTHSSDARQHISLLQM